jgi:hypothetical protein
VIRAARLGDGVPPGLAYQNNGNGEIYPLYLRIRVAFDPKAPGAIMLEV